jgi:DNA-binding transcriptional MerR regulator
VSDQLTEVTGHVLAATGSRVGPLDPIRTDSRHITRRPNGYRDYGDPAIDRLLLLLQARRTGMSISEIKTLATAFDNGALTDDLQLALLRDKLAGLDRRARGLNATCAAVAANMADLESRPAHPD